VSGRIVREVLDYAPEDLTPAEMLVFVALAEVARDRSRQVCEPAERIAARARVTVGSVNKATSQLVRRGLLVRGVEHARIGLTQRYTIVELRPEHRHAVVRKSLPAQERSSLPVQEGTSPVDNPPPVDESLPVQPKSLPVHAEEPSSTGRPPRTTPVQPPPSSWSVETKQVSGAVAVPA
jgi:DNA-binding MarR family transcriptional regulator